LVAKNSVSVIGTPVVGLTASYTLKKYCARGLYHQVKFDTVASL
jgi:predicted NAD/FAD-binding protein